MTIPPDRDPASAYEPPSTADPAQYEPPATADPAPYAPPADAASEPAGPPPGWTAPEAAPTSDPAGFGGPVAQLPGMPNPGPVAQLPGMPPPLASPYAPPVQPVYPVPPPYGAQVPYGGGYVHRPRMSDENGLAVGALVCSIIGLVSCVTSVPGVIMGHLALARTNRGESGGRGMALAAIVIGYAVIALYLAFFTTLIVLGVNGYLDN